MKKIIILQGPPACGKSTYAKKLHESNQDMVIISRDSIRESRGTYWVPSQEPWVNDVEEFMVIAALSYNLTPIIDATNLNKKTLSKWEKIAKALNAELDIREMDVPEYSEAIVRDKNRKRPVGEKVLESFYKKYYPHLIP